MTEQLLQQIKTLFAEKKFRLGSHAIRHMNEEGFDQPELAEAIDGDCRILESYADESRCLLLGYFQMSQNVRCPIHIICDFTDAFAMEPRVDIVTVYLPQKPWWDTPSRRGISKWKAKKSKK